MVVSMLGDRLRQARKNAKITQEALANSIGVKRSVISKYENGTIEPSISQLKKIAPVLGVSIAYLEGYATETEEAIYKALLSADYRAFERITGLPEGVVQPLPEDIRAAVEEYVQQVSGASEPSDSPIGRLVKLFCLLNDAGQEKALERLEELSEMPRYLRT